MLAHGLLIPFSWVAHSAFSAQNNAVGTIAITRLSPFDRLPHFYLWVQLVYYGQFISYTGRSPRSSAILRDGVGCVDSFYYVDMLFLICKDTIKRAEYLNKFVFSLT